MWALFLIIVVIVVILSFAFKGVFVLLKKSSKEVMLLGILFILTGGIFLIEPNLTKNSIIISVEYGFVIFGFLIGILGFFKS